MRRLTLIWICCFATCCHAGSGAGTAATPSPSSDANTAHVRILEGKDAPDSHIIDPVIKEHEREITFCGSAGGRDPRHVALSWLVAEDGTVGKTQVVSIGRQTDYNVAQCLVARLKTWKFPAVAGGAYWANYPFSFED